MIPLFACGAKCNASHLSTIMQYAAGKCPFVYLFIINADTKPPEQKFLAKEKCVEFIGDLVDLDSLASERFDEQRF